jgi:hypothetical protein
MDEKAVRNKPAHKISAVQNCTQMGIKRISEALKIYAILHEMGIRFLKKLNIHWWLPLIPFCIMGLLPACDLSESTESTAAVASSPFLNLHDSVQYVGMSTCRQCHSDIHATFMHTGMGQSFGAANRNKSAGNFAGHTAIYDQRFDYYYYPYWYYYYYYCYCFDTYFV